MMYGQVSSDRETYWLILVQGGDHSHLKQEVQNNLYQNHVLHPLPLQMLTYSFYRCWLQQWNKDAPRTILKNVTHNPPPLPQMSMTLHRHRIATLTLPLRKKLHQVRGKSNFLWSMTNHTWCMQHHVQIHALLEELASPWKTQPLRLTAGLLWQEYLSKLLLSFLQKRGFVNARRALQQLIIFWIKEVTH